MIHNYQKLEMKRLHFWKIAQIRLKIKVENRIAGDWYTELIIEFLRFGA